MPLARSAAVLAGLLLAAAPVRAAEAPPPPEAVALAARYLQAAEARRILDGEGPTIARYMLSKIPEPAGGPAKADEVRQAMIEAADAAVKARVPEFLRRSAEIYARVFTLPELRAIVAFYESPAGRAFVAKTPSASAPIAEAIRSLGDEIQVDARRRFCAREPESCAAPAGAPPSAPR